MKPNSPHPRSRREFLQQTTLSAAATVAGLSLAGCATGRSAQTKIPIGVQLYSVRNECKADLPGTLTAIAKMGYRGVEFAGYHGRSAKEIRQLLDDNGLVSCGTHTGLESIRPAQLAATIEFNQIIGNPYLIVPGMSGKTRADWLAHAALFNEVAAKLQPLGLWTGYHAHAHDFKLIEGEPAWDIFFGNTKPEVVMQLDTSNCRDGGADPVAVLQKYPGRTRTIHIKPNGSGPEAVVGEDQINWAGVFAYCETKGGTQWYVVEHETSKQPLATLQRTMDALKALGKV